LGTIHKSVGIVPNLDKKVGQSRSKSGKNKPRKQKGQIKSREKAYFIKITMEIIV